MNWLIKIFKKQSVAPDTRQMLDAFKLWRLKMRLIMLKYPYVED